MSGQMNSGYLLDGLAALIGRVPAKADLERAGSHLADWAACAIIGRTEPAGQALLAVQDATPSGRAFAWGGLGNILEMDDVDKRALLHPGPVIIPAALSLAYSEGIKGQALLQAVVRGYEATIRLGRAAGPAHYAYWHSTGTCGAIGAAAACSSLLELNPPQRAHAMALAVSQSAGLWQTRHEPESHGKQLHTAHAARAGLDAARLAEAGFRGPLSILEGPQGFFAAMCGQADPHAVLADPETGWRMHEVSFKPWPACRHAHAAIDAALIVRASRDIRDTALPIWVETYPDALKFCDRAEPSSVIEAKFSLQHAVAVTLLRGAPRLADFSPEAISDEAVAALRKRIHCRTAEPFQSDYPQRFGAALLIDDTRTEVRDALGDPERPMTDAQRHHKAMELLIAGGLGPEPADQLIAAAHTASPEFVESIAGYLR
jgi:2-methylcitrate dehydratase PrpD